MFDTKNEGRKIVGFYVKVKPLSIDLYVYIGYKEKGINLVWQQTQGAEELLGFMSK